MLFVCQTVAAVAMLFVCQTVAAVAMLLVCQTVAAVAMLLICQPRSARSACALDSHSLLALFSFTSTIVQILTSEELSGEELTERVRFRLTQFTCFTQLC